MGVEFEEEARMPDRVKGLGNVERDESRCLVAGPGVVDGLNRPQDLQVCPVASSEAELAGVDEVHVGEVGNKAFLNKGFVEFPENRKEGNGTVVSRRGRLRCFGDGGDDCRLPGRGEEVGFPTGVEKFEEDRLKRRPRCP